MDQFGLNLSQEHAMNGWDPPSRYVLSKGNHPIDAVSPPSPVPVIDLSCLSKSDTVEAAKLKSAAETWGLFLATGHGVPFSLLDEVLSMTKEFFDLPVEERQRYTNIKDGKNYQFEGYGSDPIVTDDQTLDWCDRLFLLVQPEDRRDLSLWPDVPKSFRDILHEFTAKCKQTGDHIVRVIAKQLGLNENYIVDQYLDETSEIGARFTYYPQCTMPDAVFGIKPHSDGSFVTILLLDKDVGGLQVLKDNQWVEMISNGIIKSPLHRVLTNAEKPRISVVMFYGPGPKKELKPADALISEERPSLYKKVKAEDYATSLLDLFAKTGGRAVDLFKTEHEE